jgi:hypothetical protein
MEMTVTRNPLPWFTRRNNIRQKQRSEAELAAAKEIKRCEGPRRRLARHGDDGDHHQQHGGRSFLHGHIFGDNVHEYLAPCIYEGEGEMLCMGFFKSLIKEPALTVLPPTEQSFLGGDPAEMRSSSRT